VATTAFETFFRSALSFSTCSFFFALLTAMIRFLSDFYVGTAALGCPPGAARQCTTL
jgi:hypothetical protein